MGLQERRDYLNYIIPLTTTITLPSTSIANTVFTTINVVQKILLMILLVSFVMVMRVFLLFLFCDMH